MQKVGKNWGQIFIFDFTFSLFQEEAHRSSDPTSYVGKIGVKSLSLTLYVGKIGVKSLSLTLRSVCFKRKHIEVLIQRAMSRIKI